MGVDYHAVCRETKESIRLGRLYEWSGIDRREWADGHIPDPRSGEAQVDVGYGYMLRLITFMHAHQGKLVEIISDEPLWDLKHEHSGWKELEDVWRKEGLL